jgi:hypothetical protein
MSILTLSEAELAPFAGNVSTYIDTIAAKTLGTATFTELTTAIHAGYDLGLANYVNLKPHLVHYAANSGGFTPEMMHLFRLMTIESRIRAVVEDNIQYFDSSQTIIVPENCYKMLVSFQAAGGNSGASKADDLTNGYGQSGSGGGGGAGVFEYEIDTVPNAEHVLTLGNSMTLGLLEVEAGGNGNFYQFHNAYSTADIPGGVGGRVLWNNNPVDNGATIGTAIAGTDGGVGTSSSVYSGVLATTNGKLQGGGGGSSNGTAIGSSFYGAGGGASPHYDGEDQLQAGNPAEDNRITPLGAGAASPNGIYTSQSTYNNYVLGRPGGEASEGVTINFLQQLA